MTVNTGEIKLATIPRTRRNKVKSVLRVRHGERWIGDILIAGRQRVWRHADTVPADVVLKILFAFTRQTMPTSGQVVGRDTGWVYSWELAAE